MLRLALLIGPLAPFGISLFPSDSYDLQPHFVEGQVLDGADSFTATGG